MFRDCRVWVNGYLLTRNASGYAPFRVDFTDVANLGGLNAITLRVDASEGEGWFYEGAGVYRHVWLVKTDPVHVPQWGTFVRSTVNGASADLALTTEVANDSDTARDCEVVSTLFDPDGKPVALVRGPWSVPPRATASLDQRAALAGPRLWSIETPALYRLDTEVVSAGATLDRYSTTFGIRTIHFDPAQGFFLNGAHVKIKGTCNHQDHAGVGTAIPDRLQAWRVERLKAMGSNAYRTSHNPPAPSLLDACDRLGMLVLDETRRMSSPPSALEELESMVRRDRNRPSVFLWCIGNEEPQEVTAAGGRIAETMKRRVYQLDGTRPVTEAMDFGWGRRHRRQQHPRRDGHQLPPRRRGDLSPGAPDRADHPHRDREHGDHARRLCPRSRAASSPAPMTWRRRPGPRPRSSGGRCATRRTIRPAVSSGPGSTIAANPRRSTAGPASPPTSA